VLSFHILQIQGANIRKYSYILSSLLLQPAGS
jgi:hypothetical protein